jgi:hypothetical protein
MQSINNQSAKSRTIFIIVLLLTITGIISLIYSPNIEKKLETKWALLEAENASLNALAIAKQMLQANLLKQDCLNTAGCPFWNGYHKLRLTNKNGQPNINWWKKNSYKIPNYPNKAKFIVITMANNLYKIIAFAEDHNRKQAFISSCYYKLNDNP